MAGSLRSPNLLLGISAPVGETAGYRSWAAPWLGGASAPSQVTLGYRGIAALWMGGASARVSAPIPPPTPQEELQDGAGSRKRRDQTNWEWEQEKLRKDLIQDEIEVLNLANIVIMLLCQDD